MNHIYQNIGSPQILNYKRFYEDMAERIPDGGRFVEVGVFYGMSFSFFVVESLNRGKKIDCVAVDACPWYPEPCSGFDKAMKPLEGHFRTMFERVDSFVAAKNFENESIDFVFIDANHAYEFVSKDIASYLPKVKKGGVLAGHDWSDEGVKKAAREAFPISLNVDVGQDIWWVEVGTRKHEP